MPDGDPLILTAAFDPVAAATFQHLRNRHFPPHLNRVPAHLTLFHALPGVDRDAVATALHDACSSQPSMAFATGGLRFLGRGVSIAVEAADLDRLRMHLAAGWRAWLTPQDRQAFRPHVTIQNKADAADARALMAQLQQEGLVVTGTLVGLDLWHYRGGPWERAGHFGFGR